MKPAERHRQTGNQRAAAGGRSGQCLGSSGRTHPDSDAPLPHRKTLRKIEGTDPRQGHHPDNADGLHRHAGNSRAGKSAAAGIVAGILHWQRSAAGEEDLTMSAKTFEILGGRAPDAFLRDYWQKKPLLIRNAFPDIEGLLEPDELAGLALEEEIESRIIIERSPVDWELRHGPFTEKTFKTLPQTHWTLLIQALDHYVPQIADLLEHFDFVPNWRIDDIMASFAPFGGSVGPHYDYYDVFLIQAHGQRRWQLGQTCDDTTALLPDLPIRILKDFQPDQEWVLNPGDMLYLPPGLAHYGVAQNDCMTLSVGFRAPSEQDILMEFVHTLFNDNVQDRRYEDKDLKLQANPGWISPEAVGRVSEILRRAVSDPQKIARWMASYLSQTKYEQAPEPPEDDYSEVEGQDLVAANQC